MRRGRHFSEILTYNTSVVIIIKTLIYYRTRHTSAHTFPAGSSMASDIVAELTASLAKTAVDEVELSYKGQGRKLDNAESVEDMVKEIEAFPDLQALRLEGNTVGVEAARAIAKALEKKSQFKCAYWSDMFTGRLRSEIPPALNSLGDALMLAGARLNVLDLSDNAFDPDGVKGIE